MGKVVLGSNMDTCHHIWSDRSTFRQCVSLNIKKSYSVTYVSCQQTLNQLLLWCTIPRGTAVASLQLSVRI